MNIALLGFGTVGTGVFELLKKNHIQLYGNYSNLLEIKHILVRNLKKYSGRDGYELITTDFNNIIEAKNIDVVIEVMGGIHPAYDFILRSLKQGRHVITANKELIAKYGKELIEVARQNGVNLLYEASVGGAIPIIDALANGLSGYSISELTGIINGTSNFILSSMKEKQMIFEDALKLAQNLGYAESQPDSDIHGIDAARKLVILSFIAYGHIFDMNKITIEGITNITLDDIRFANRFGYEIKLLARSKKDNDNIYAIVAPFLVKKDHHLSIVNDVNNAVVVKCDAADELLFIGKGAGKYPTACAIISNIIDISRNRLSYLPKLPIAYSEVNRKEPFQSYYIRLRLKNMELDENTIHILSKNIYKYELIEDNLIILTKRCTEKNLEELINILCNNLIIENMSKIRVYSQLQEDNPIDIVS